ncbi:MAG: PIN domain-containing protein [Saprospiraceae bacterium]|nr:PIN domain-containing protein [Saprospiraceae bacterium]
MDTLLVDTNVVLDLLAKRENYFIEAQELFTLSDHNQVQLNVSSLTFANTHYKLFEQLKTSNARKILRNFKVLVNVISLNDKIIELSLDSEFKHFEDAIQYYTALECGADIIITRNQKDFKLAQIPILTAKEYMKLRG